LFWIWYGTSSGQTILSTNTTISKLALRTKVMDQINNNQLSLEQFKDIYGDYLEINSKHLDEALIWSTAGQEEKAIHAFKKCGHWRKVIYLSQKIGKTNIQEIAKDMADDLVENFKFKDAAFIYESYCNDFELAFNTLIRGDFYDDAIRICFRLNQPELLEEKNYTVCIRCI